jgi:hypothetical protein
MATKLLDRFQALFDGQQYHHRKSNLGDKVAQYLYEDLYGLAQSAKLLQGVSDQKLVLNSRNLTHGVQHRRGDGTFGIVIPGETVTVDPGFAVARGPVATILVGAEVKIVSKAMVRQIDRVKNDLIGSVREFRKSNPRVLTLGIVGVNHASVYLSYEGPDRSYLSTGKGKHLHPIQEAGKVAAKLGEIRDKLDELLVLRFEATNMEPYPFSWVDPQETTRDYSSVLVRLSSQFDQRF